MLDFALLSGNTAPSLAINFLTGALDPRVTLTRASTGWAFNSAGTLASATTNTARFDYDPTALTLNGLLLEGASTNGIRNNSMTGAVVSGALPTNWAQSNTTGLTASVIAVGTDHGIPYIDVRVNGTTATGTTNNILFEGSAQVAAVQSGVWSSSVYLSLTSGSLTNVSAIKNFMQPLNNVGGSLTQSSASPTVTNAALASQRSVLTYTLPDATTAFLRSYVQVVFSAAPVAVDLTLRIGAPQLEPSAFATSPILTTTVAVTRAAEVLSARLPSTPGNGASMVVETMPRSVAQTVFAQIDDGSDANSLKLSSPTGSNYGYTSTVASVAIANSTITGTPAVGTALKFGISSSAASRLGVCLNGGAVTVDTTAGSFPPGMTTLRPGRLQAATTGENSWCRALRFWPRAISDSELQNATR